MNNSGIIFTILIFVIGAFLPSRNSISSIYGTLDPQDAADKVYAIHNTDTLAVIPQAGKFSIAVTGGVWKLYIRGVKPFKDVTIDNIRVTDGKSTNAGLIHMTAN
jgi:hypothetical protein